MPECDCFFITKTLGDGCAKCNPELHIQTIVDTNVKRYDFVPGDVCGYNCCAQMKEDEDGIYVKYEDIVKFIKDLYAKGSLYS